MLRDMALLGLKLEGYTFDATLYNNNKAIQEAAYKILQKWVERQKNRKRAYRKLLAALKDCGFNLMATELKKSVENYSPSSTSSSEED